MNTCSPDELTSLPNIGPTLKCQLNEIGIYTAEQLVELGAEKCFLRLKERNQNISLYSLYAIEGAIEGRKRHLLDTQRRIALKTFFNQSVQFCYAN